MTRLAYAAALFLLILAALFAALAVILARPRVGFYRAGRRNVSDYPTRPGERELCREPGCWLDLGHGGRHLVEYAICGCGVVTGGAIIHKPNCAFGVTFTTGSPESVTWSTENGTGLDPRLMGV